MCVCKWYRPEETCNSTYHLSLSSSGCSLIFFDTHTHTQHTHRYHALPFRIHDTRIKTNETEPTEDRRYTETVAGAGRRFYQNYAHAEVAKRKAGQLRRIIIPEKSRNMPAYAVRCVASIILKIMPA